MDRYPRSFFRLNFDFAQALAKHYQISLVESLFKYSSFYTRIVGFSNEGSPQSENATWQAVVNGLPEGSAEQFEYLVSNYAEQELLRSQRSSPENENQFGCFSYTYHPEKNSFALHFTNVDEKGNLAKDRVSVRMQEWTQLVASIKHEQKPGATMSMTSWLLSIEAMKRLLPPRFIQTAQPRNKGLAQDNGWWGQFLDKDGYLKKDLARQLLDNAKIYRPLVDEYFPIRTLRAEVPQEVFFEFYRH